MSAQSISLNNVPFRYRSRWSTQSDCIRSVVNQPPTTSTAFNLPASGLYKTVFQIPNRAGAFVNLNMLQFVGNINFNITSTNGADTFTAMQPNIDYVQAMVNSYILTIGGVQVARSLNTNHNLLNLSIQENSLNNNAYAIYQNLAWTGLAAPTDRPFRMNLNYLPGEFFAKGAVPFRLDSTALCTMLPCFLSGVIQLEIYLNPPQYFVSTVAGYTPAGTLTATAALDDVHLELVYVESASLLADVKMNGWTREFLEADYVPQIQAAVGPGGNNTTQVPCSYRMTNYVLSVLQRQDDLTNLTIPMRARLASADASPFLRYQIKINGKTVSFVPLLSLICCSLLCFMCP